jgi:hypothetical protein
VLPDLRRHLEDDELAGPRGEPALAAELPNLGSDGHQGVSGCLIRKIIKLRASKIQLGAPSRHTPGDPNQQLVQARQRIVTR